MRLVGKGRGCDCLKLGNCTPGLFLHGRGPRGTGRPHEGGCGRSRDAANGRDGRKRKLLFFLNLESAGRPSGARCVSWADPTASLSPPESAEHPESGCPALLRAEGRGKDEGGRMKDEGGANAKRYRLPPARGVPRQARDFPRVPTETFFPFLCEARTRRRRPGWPGRDATAGEERAS